MKVSTTHILTIVTISFVSSQLASARFMRPDKAPIERLIASQSAYIKKNPQDWQATYTLARIHYLAFVHDANTLGVYKHRKNESSRLAHHQDFTWGPINTKAEELVRAEMNLTANPKWNDPNFKQFSQKKQAQIKELQKKKWSPPKKAPVDIQSHYNHSIELFQKVIDNTKDPALATLGMASLQEQYAKPEYQERLKNIKNRKQAATKQHITELYYKAFSLSQQKDSKKRMRPLLGISNLVSYESGNAYLRLSPTGKHIAEITQHIAKLKKLPPGPITPLVVDLSGKRTSITQLIDNSKSISFDLTGLGRKDSYAWPHHDAGFLVWDPENTQKITSGRQLFGVYSWEIFWKDGFQALAALDDNADGNLTGSELKGIAIWQDQNQNGISEMGEVKPLSSHHITSLSTIAERKDQGHPYHSAGATKTDSHTLPVWDWLAEPRKK